MTRSTNMEHVEVLRAMLVDEYPEGSDDGSPTFTLERAALTAAIAALSAPQSGDAESKLAEAGVFAGHHGLRGLADADVFWEKQPYGTRLYYGDGGMDYLHRGVLQKAVEILDAAPQPPAEALLCDARRYRWLREHGRYSGKVLVDHADMGRVLRIEKQLDEIIDAEMQRISAQEASND